MNPMDLVPHSVEAEQALLGALLMDGRCWDVVSDVVAAADFYRDDHRTIFATIGVLAAEGKGIDVVSVFEALQRAGSDQSIGGLAYLGELANASFSTALAKRHAEIIAERATIRALITAGSDIQSIALAADGGTVEERVAAASSRIAQIEEAGARQGTGPVGAREAVQRTLVQIDSRLSDATPRRYATGLARLDEQLFSYAPSGLVIIAGRPGMGKTSLAMACAEAAAFDDKREGAVIVFTMEMSIEELTQRSISRLGRIPLTSVIEGKLNDHEWSCVTMATSQLAESAIHIDETPALHINQVRARTNAIRRRHGVRLVVVDYLQLMRGDGENRTQQIGAVSRGLKALAKECHCPVIALSQLNRKVEDRPNKRPHMSDLRESGDIEQDADLILFAYRDEVYNPDSQDKGTAELIIGKQRSGPAGGIVRVAWHGPTASFRDLDEDAWHEQQRAARDEAARNKPMRRNKGNGFD
ncbi:replicative DNA helicase [Uliginosibacterium sp. sgz301328]|uniref:replicative DNA helicase n=1 Tax=Uliginosibacterium sp. sgz301328 TaxID=3243764 RepID=UPI00359D71D6